MSGLAIGSGLLPSLPHAARLNRPVLLGRTIYLNYVFDKPSFNGRHIGAIPAESVFSIYSTVKSDDNHYNRTWYEAEQGYVHSASVQPVRWAVQRPILNIPAAGLLGEVTVPFTLAKAGPGPHYSTAYHFYFSTTYWITAAQRGADGGVWYQSVDDRTLAKYWVRGEHIRPVADVEMAPIAPEAANKRIEVDLEKQVLKAFQGSELLLETLCSTGRYLRTENGNRIFGTPSGDWSILRKRPTRHMAGDDAASADFFDLPGVPWVSYFHWWGVSLHGTYWHNDYGRPHSHGCVNLPPDVAKWLFRWSMPPAGIEQKETLANGSGTPMLVFSAPTTGAVTYESPSAF